MGFKKVAMNRIIADKRIFLAPLIFLVFYFLTPQMAAAVFGLPSDRNISWLPGIPGGINSSQYTTTINVKNYGATGNGSTDDTSAIQNAINAAGDYTVVYLPAGTYRTTAPIRLKSKMILRGAGPSQTKIVNYGTANEILGANGSAGTEVSVTGGYNRGSTQVTVNNASAFSIGDIVLISQENGEPFSSFDDTPSFYRRTVGQLNSVVSKSGNTIGLSRPLYYNYNQNYNITLLRYDSVITGLGIEDLYIERASQGGDHNIYIENGYQSWVKNIESYRGKNWHVALYSCFQCEVRDSYIHHAATDAGGNADYGVQLFKRTTDTLVENNIFDRTRHAMILEWGGQGNVFGYNYSINPINEGMEGTDYLMADMVSHGGTPMFNLWEGNIGQNFDMDNILGGSLYETAFRNWIQAKSIPTVGPGSQWAVEFQKHNYYGNVVGNVLMKQGDTGDYEYIPYQSGRAVYRLGFKSSNDDNPDPQSKATLLRHGNFDYITNQTRWDPSYSDHSIPSSLYLSGKPSWFGNLSWPPFGPDPNNAAQIFVRTIPATERFGASGGSGIVSGGGDPPPQNQPPSISITSPANNATFNPGATIPPITATASDSADSISQVAFYRNGSLFAGGIDYTAPWSYQWGNAGAGTYTIFAEATDSRGAIGRSPSITITVGSPSPAPSSCANPATLLGAEPCPVLSISPDELTITASPSGSYISTKLFTYPNMWTVNGSGVLTPFLVAAMVITVLPLLPSPFPPILEQQVRASIMSLLGIGNGAATAGAGSVPAQLFAALKGSGECRVLI